MATIEYSYTEWDYPHLESVLREFGNAMEDYMRQHLAENGTNASETLTRSIKHIINKDGQDYEISISLEEYWKYVENGTKPHWPPREAIISWILVKPVIPEERNGKLPTIEQLGYLIRRKISEDGTEAQPFFWRSVEEAMAEFEQRIGEAIEQDVDYNVETLLLPLYSI